MTSDTKILIGLSLVLLLTVPFIATTIVDASSARASQETNGMNAGGLRGIVGWLRGFRQRLGRYGFVEVSEEFKTSVITIAESDTDVQDLLAEGYHIVRVLPIIKSSVDANGAVTSKATTAVLILKTEDAKSLATVWVDLNVGTVTKIATLTWAVTKKT